MTPASTPLTFDGLASAARPFASVLSALTSLVLWTAGLAGCGDTPSQDIPRYTNPCGGERLLRFDGQYADPGEACGVCGDGVLTCDGREALVCEGAADLNACGGCEPLDAAPGDECLDGEARGQWQCDAAGTLECVVTSRNACGGSAALEGEPGEACGTCGQGVVVCDGGNATRCEDADRGANGCGGCEPLEHEPGGACGECGRGRWVCEGVAATVCEDAPCPQWEVVTIAAEDVGVNGATLVGLLEATHPEEVSGYGFCWKALGSAALETQCHTIDGLVELARFAWTNAWLLPGRWYEAQAFVSSEEGTYRGEWVEFRTEAAIPQVVASQGTRADGVLVEWEAIDGALEYVVERDGHVFARLEEASLFDAEVHAALEAVGGLQASQGASTEHVQLTWRAHPEHAGEPHVYTVRAIYPDAQSAWSQAAEGYRGAAEIGYELQIDDGPWSAVGTGVAHADLEGGLGVVQPGRARASRGTIREHVRIEVSAASVEEHASSYRVRAVTEYVAGPASEPASGWRAVGAIEGRWQATDDDALEGFAELAGAGVDAPFEDADLPDDGTRRYYRVAYSAPGARPATSNVAAGFRAGFGMPDHRLLLADAPVNAIARDGDTLYLGGRFRSFGPRVGSLVAVDAAQGHALDDFPDVDGSVYAIVRDEHGGYFIGGDFTRVAGLDRRGLAYIKPDGTLDTDWGVEATGRIRALAYGDGKLYASGGVVGADGVESQRLVKIDVATGLLHDWEGTHGLVAGLINALALHGDTLYAGGSISDAYGMPRSRLAAFRTSTGELLPWAPRASGTVLALVATADRIYIGGTFSNIGNTPRARLAAVEPVTGTLLPWNPGADEAVRALAHDGQRLFVGGDFTQVGGVATGPLAVLDDENVQAWDSGIAGEVYAIALDDGVVRVAGNFERVGDAVRHGAAAFTNALQPQLLPWAGGTANIVHAIAGDGQQVVLGGDFGTRAEVERSHLAAVDLQDFSLTPWAPEFELSVRDLVFDETTVYVCSSARGPNSRYRIAAIDRATGAIRWQTDAGAVNTLALDGGTLYVGGTFHGIERRPGDSTTMFGTPQRLAALDAATGHLLDWDPEVSHEVYDLLVHNGELIVAGTYDTIAGQPRMRLASFALPERTLTDWNPGTDFSVQAVAADANGMVVAGTFNTVSGQPRQRIALFEPDGTLSPWQMNDSSITTILNRLAMTPDVIYVDFPGNSILRLDRATGANHGWPNWPTRTPRMTAMLATDDYLFVGIAETSLPGPGLAGQKWYGLAALYLQ